MMLMQLSRHMNNLEIAELLRDVAAVYLLKNPLRKRFEIIAYNEAAESIEHQSREVKDIWADNKLDDIPGIGQGIASYLDELFKTGTIGMYEKLFASVPAAIFPLMRIPGIGPKSAYKLALELKLKEKDAVKALADAARKGKIATIEGFGEKSQATILETIEGMTQKSRRFLLSYASTRAEEVVEWLRRDRYVDRVEVLGSLRRRAPTVGDIDLVAATDKPSEVVAHFTHFPGTSKIMEVGPHKATILVPGGVQIDLRVQETAGFGSLLQHFTGSKAHNIALREYAMKKALSLSEYGIKKAGKLKPYASEEAFYAALGMDWIPPEMRENTGEIEAALARELPHLIELKDVKADLQIHSDFDIETSHDIGVSSMSEIVSKAASLGYEYLAFTEHNPAQKAHKAADFIRLLKRKREVINKLKLTGSVKKVFNSLEIDVLPDGSLPVPDQAMELLDFALVSIHSVFRQPKAEATKRVLRALAHPKVKILAHPTGRLLMKREGIELDWQAIFDFCLKHHKWLEINADPSRLDLPDGLVREAIKRGVILTLGTDSHSIAGLDNMRYGIDVARRGWAEKANIANTYPLAKFLKLLSVS